jgi:hypothetical protein
MVEKENVIPSQIPKEIPIRKRLPLPQRLHARSQEHKESGECKETKILSLYNSSLLKSL